MKLSSSDSPISPTLRPLGGLLGSSFGYLPMLQPHSYRRPLNHSFSHYPQVAQRKQRDQVRRVFDQARVKLTLVVLGGAGRANQSGINDHASFEQQAPLDQLSVRDGKHLKSQIVVLKQVTESENGALIRQARSARVELDQASQLRPRHKKIHLVEKLTLTRSLGDQFKSDGGEGGLFHEEITFKSGVTMIFAELP